MPNGSIRDIFRGRAFVLPDAGSDSDANFFEFRLAEEGNADWRVGDAVAFEGSQQHGRMVATNVSIQNAAVSKTGTVFNVNSTNRIGMIHPDPGQGPIDLAFRRADMLPDGAPMARDGQRVSYRPKPGTVDRAIDGEVLG